MSGNLYAECMACGSINRFEQERTGQAVCGKCKERLDARRATRDTSLIVTDASFPNEVYRASVPVLVDFFATWCGACKSIEPALESLAFRYKGRFKVAKLDVEKNPRSAAQYQIRATPTLIVFTNGRPAERLEGALPLPQLQELAERYIRFTTRPR